MTHVAVRQGTEAWLAARRQTIGSSDIPIIVGESTFKSAYTLAAEKLGIIEPVVDAETQELFDIGLLMQPMLLRIYERKTGRHATGEVGWRAHPTIAWATASLDGRSGTKREPRVVEAKWSNSARWRSGENVPPDVQTQVQWQLFVTGWGVADVVVLDHGVPRVEEVARDDGLIDNLVYFARDFYEHLERRELPPVDLSDGTRQTLGRMHRDTGVRLPATPELTALVGDFRGAKAATKAAEDHEGTLGNAIRSVLLEAEGIEGLVSFRRNRDSTRVNWPAVAKAYRTLLEKKEVDPDTLDTLQSIHSETVEGVPVLRLLKGASE